MDGKAITKSYVYHSGGFEFNRIKFANFLGDFPELTHELPRMELEKAVKANLKVVAEELDPLVDSNEIEEIIATSNNDITVFLKQAHGNPLSKVVAQMKDHHFVKGESKLSITKALKTLYAEEMADFGNDSLGGYDPTDTVNELDPNPMYDATDKQDAKQSPDLEAPEEPMPAASDAGDEFGTTTESRLDPKLEEDSIFTIEAYLQKDVFGSKLIPTVKIVEARPLKGTDRYVIDLEFSSKDGQTRAYAAAAIYNGKLVLPAELETEDGEVIGEFTKETFQGLFSVEEAGTPRNDNDYTSLMDDLQTAPSYTEASIIIDTIIEKFGSGAGKHAFETFTKFQKKGGDEVQKNFAAARLDVRLGETDIDPSRSYTGNLSEADEDAFLSELEKKLSKEGKK